MFIGNKKPGCKKASAYDALCPFIL